MEIVLTLLVFLLFFAAMALGLILRKKPLQGSCGGVAALMGDKQCQFCGNDPSQCEKTPRLTDPQADPVEPGLPSRPNML